MIRKTPDEKRRSPDTQASDDEQRMATLAAEVAARAEREDLAHRRSQADQKGFEQRLPRWEYKVLTNSVLAGLGAGKAIDLEPILNRYAAQGWRVIAMSFTGQIEQLLATDKNHLYIVLERPALGSGHTGHPVEGTAQPHPPPSCGITSVP